MYSAHGLERGALALLRAGGLLSCSAAVLCVPGRVVALPMVSNEPTSQVAQTESVTSKIVSPKTRCSNVEVITEYASFLPRCWGDSPRDMLEAEVLGLDPGGSDRHSSQVLEDQALVSAGSQDGQIAKASETEQVRQELFEQVFGKPEPGQLSTVIVPWSINQEPQGDIGVSIGWEAQDVRWTDSSFLDSLREVIKPELYSQLVDFQETQPLSIHNLERLGIQAEFDAQALTLNIQLAPEQLRVNVVSAQQEKRKSRSEADVTLQPARLSGYLNTRGSLGWTWLPERDGEPGLQPVALQWDGAVNYKGWVFEGRTRFLQDSLQPWQRGDLRVVRDRPDWAMRFQAGEITSPITGYQRGSSILGVSATRQFGLQPDLVTRPVSSYEFFLEAPSKVEVFVNGDRDRILDLPAGTQDLRDFSLGAGINEVELRITDPVGRERLLQFFAPVTTQLLAPGLQQFAYSLGAPIEKEGNARHYNFAETLATASYRWGVTPRLTTGTYLQATTRQQMLGTDGVMATAVGNWDWDAAMSLDPEAGLGYGARVGYEYQRSGDVQQKSLRLGLEYGNDRFLGVGEEQPNNRVPLEANLSYRQKLMAQVNGSLAGRYQWTDDGNAYRVSVSLSRPVGSGRTLGVKLSHSQPAGGDDGEQQVRVNLLWSMPQRGQTVIASTESNLAGEQRRRTSWNYKNRASLNAFNTGFDLSDDGETWDLAHKLAWRGGRATLGLKTDATGDRDSRLDWSGMESQLSFGTSFVFADGHLGWSRPVDGSFALLVPHRQLRGRKVAVNPSTYGAAAVLDRWGAAVLPGLSEYRMNTINLDSPSLPLGYSLGQSSHRLKPGYRQGALVRVGEDSTVFLRGILQGLQEQSAELLLGEVSSLDDPTWPGKTLFTNRVGKFAIEGMKPGRYQVRLTNGERATFTIPEDAVGLYNIGEILLDSVEP